MRPARPRAKPGDVRVRRFRPSDVDLFCDYFFRSPRAFLRGLGLRPFPPGEEQRRRARWAEAFRLARRGKERIKVLTVLFHGRPVGIHPLTDVVEGRSGVMHAHFFQPKDRGRGIGRISYVKAMGRFIREFGLREILFKTPTHNPAPLRIKEALGLRAIGSCVYKSPLTRPGLRARVFRVRRRELPAVALRVGVRAAALLSLLGLFLPVRAAAPAPGPAPKPWAAVSPCKAVFFFPAKADGWRWDLPKTQLDMMEYAWLVDVPIGPTRMQWGVTKFRWRRGPAESGTLKDLLARSQTNAWDVTKRETAAVDQAARVAARAAPAEGGLRIVVAEPKHLAELYRLKTSAVGFKTVDHDAPKGKTVQVPVHYLESLEEVGEEACPKQSPST